MAFRLREYVELLAALRDRGYGLGPCRTWFGRPSSPFVFLKHDVDRLCFRAVQMARAERDLGVASTYYFRCDRAGRFATAAIRQVRDLGHEIGFHYECIAQAAGDRQAARVLFDAQLARLRELAEIRTIAAHGSPMSRHSNMGYGREVELDRSGLLGEPGLDFDFARVLYVTDTGGIFGSSINLRDRVDGRNLTRPLRASELADTLDPKQDPQVLLNCHPERWAISAAGWLQAATLDRTTNLAKQVIMRLRSSEHVPNNA